MIATKPLDAIYINKDGSGRFEGPNAVSVWQLSLLAQGLKLELARPPEAKVRPFSSNLRAAKETTGLKTNDRVAQLERVLLMLEQAKSQVVYLEEEE